jgi:hypothetical protein
MASVYRQASAEAMGLKKWRPLRVRSISASSSA